MGFPSLGAATEHVDLSAKLQRCPRSSLLTCDCIGRRWWGVGAPILQGLPQGPESPPAFRAPAAGPPRDHTSRDGPPSRARARAGSKPLGAIPCVTGRLQSPLAGARHVHRVTLAIGRRVGRAQGSAGDAASSAAAAGPRSGPCARPGETLCGAPGGESVLLLVARPAGRPGPAGGAREQGCGQAGAAEPQQCLGLPALTCEPDPPAPGLRSRRAKRAKRFGTCSQLGARRAVPRRLSLGGGLLREAFCRSIPRGGAGARAAGLPGPFLSCSVGRHSDVS